MVSRTSGGGFLTNATAAKHFWVGDETEGRMTPSLPSSMAFLVALWLGFAPFILHYYSVNNPVWPSLETTMALTVMLFAFARMIAPRDFPWLSVVNAVLGGLLIVVAMATQVLATQVPLSETANDLVVGALLLNFGALSASMTYRLKSWEQRHRR